MTSPVLSVTESSESMLSAMPSRSRSAGSDLSRLIQPWSSALCVNVPVGSAGAPVARTANSVPPGMPSSDSVSVCSRPVVLICSSAEPCRNTPYCSRKEKLVANDATPQNSRSSRPSPVSRMNLAAPEARLPSLITLIVPEASSLIRNFLVPSAQRPVAHLEADLAADLDDRLGEEVEQAQLHAARDVDEEDLVGLASAAGALDHLEGLGGGLAELALDVLPAALVERDRDGAALNWPLR